MAEVLKRLGEAAGSALEAIVRWAKLIAALCTMNGTTAVTAHRADLSERQNEEEL